ncbi:terpene cyclase/mutase family protein [Streptomyces sp. NBC_01476]|uniref:prenyltransferase/squalene oxidase repeat-containing protein n=1 Tax=Streptomyces sp. NBC_01476 TaxID=2903881 RepID=UPI002E34D13B|nr:prenyltransferase/squalene oxidase repeat-containing protein [Streptomyces sp. NBC_01476]
MPLRRRAALAVTATATALLALAAVPAAPANAATPPAGLYGATDPTYDGVWRQAYALLALHTAGVTPPAAAVRWLGGQQCADGGFPSYRADTATACDAKTEDTNATGIAVQALSVLGGHGPAVTKATGWLKSVQNADGGWSYNPGGASDPDSTAVVIGALQTAGEDTLPAKAGRTPYDALRGFQFGCGAKAADRGSYGYPADGKLAVNAKATADAVRGARSAGFVVTAPTRDTPLPAAPACGGAKDPYTSMTPAAAAQAGAAWLARQLTAGGGHLTAPSPGATKATPDYGTTADAVVALAAAGELTAARSAYTWLAANSTAWSHGSPAALSQLILAAHATGNDPRGTGGTDYVQQLTTLGPAADEPAATASSAAPEEKKHDSSSSTSTWLIVAVFFIASVGVGFLLSGRKRRQG